jgi:lysophospholipase L1-like esterase
LVKELRSKNITVVIQATLYVGVERESWKEKNEEVTLLNTELRAYSLRENIQFIDINPFVCKNSLLKPEFTVDGLHLTAGGYALWLPEVEKALVSNGI